MTPERRDQGGNCSIATYSKNTFKQILSISIIAQPIPQSPSLLTHRSDKNPFLLRSGLAISGIQHILIWLVNDEDLTPLTRLLGKFKWKRSDLKPVAIRFLLNLRKDCFEEQKDLTVFSLSL